MIETVLVVDASREVVDTLGGMLSLRFAVATATCAREAREILADGDRSIAVLLAGARIGGGDGAGLLRHAREVRPDVVRLLALETHDFDLAVRAVEFETFRVLVAPWVPEDVALAVDEALARRRSTLPVGTEEDEVTAYGAACDLDERLVQQLATLRTLNHFALSLNAAESLQEIAETAAHAVYEVIPGHGVKVLLWDDEAPRGAIEADDGPEMSSSMHTETLVIQDGSVGEIIVDVRGPSGSRMRSDHRDVLALIAAPTAVAAHKELRRRERDQAQHDTITALARLAEHRDGETGLHIERVSEYCRILAEGLREDGHYRDRVDDAFVLDLVRSAPLHDIGKVGVPDSILLKPGRLNAAEWEIMRTHAEIGAHTLDEVIRKSRNPGYLEMGRDIAWCHHERWDGTGYPRELAGEAIPLAARIVALADIYDALTTERPYKRAWAHDDAARWILGLRGNHLDPFVVDAFEKRLDQMDQVRVRLCDRREPLERVADQLVATVF